MQINAMQAGMGKLISNQREIVCSLSLSLALCLSFSFSLPIATSLSLCLPPNNWPCLPLTLILYSFTPPPPPKAACVPLCCRPWKCGRNALMECGSDAFAVLTLKGVAAHQRSTGRKVPLCPFEKNRICSVYGAETVSHICMPKTPGLEIPTFSAMFLFIFFYSPRWHLVRLERSLSNCRWRLYNITLLLSSKNFKLLWKSSDTNSCTHGWMAASNLAPVPCD